MKQFFRERDALGYTPQMTYKKKEQFGTTLGGCCSQVVCCFIFVYVVTILAAFGFGGRNYD